MAILGRSGQFGTSLSSCYGGRELCASGHSKSPASVNYMRLSSEGQQKLVILKGITGMKNLLASGAHIARQSDSHVAAKRPELIARSTISLKDNQCFHHVCHCQRTDEEPDQAEAATDPVEETWGIRFAIALLKFYKTVMEETTSNIRKGGAFGTFDRIEKLTAG